MINRYFALLLFFIVFSFSVSGQKFVSDSLVVEFGKGSPHQINAIVDTVIDQRKLSPNCIAITERKKYYNVPIDYRILTSKPLGTGIKEMFSNSPDSATNKYKLEIKEFNIRSIPKSSKNHFSCNSIISVYSVRPQANTYLGTLVYETSDVLKRTKKQPQKEYEAFIDSWKDRFATDMNAIALHSPADPAFSLPNMVRKQSDFRKNMIISTDVAIGTDSWVVDGEIMFSRPEPQARFVRQGSILRYRHEKTYESLEFPMLNKQYNHRLNNNFVFILKPKLFWGLNRWNDNEYAKHGLQDLLIFDCSVTQSMVYNPFYKKSIVCGLGVMENATYIYSEQVKFKPYAVFQLGIKF
jgi:hypothetical protein